MKSDFQLNSENFEMYFMKQITGMSDAAKEALPKELSAYIMHPDGRFKLSKIPKLGFLAKLWMLWKCAKKRVWIVVENEESGLNLEEFLALRKGIRERDVGVQRAMDLQLTATFVTSDRELSNTFNYLARVSNSPAYNYLIKEKNFRQSNDMSEHEKRMRYIARILKEYEINKAKWMKSKGLRRTSIIALFHFFERGEAQVKQAAISGFISGRTLSNCLAPLCARGYIERVGIKKNGVYRITSEGASVVHYILNNYVI